MKPLSDLQADWPALNRLLDEALDLPPAERGAWLAALPAEAAGLKDTVARLLSATGGAETGDFMHTLPKLGAAPAGPAASGAQIGAEVGPWRLLREIGEGGMGSVWLAERADGSLKRQVALKLPRLSWQRGLAERMARERDILATLEHPHIARLYDAGVDTLGRPWLALEYVQGQPIDEHARDKALDVKQRVQLLLQVCEAVAYAHSRLVIHRDLKPGNILVTDDGQVKLLDFGIAKLVQGERADATALTELGGRALTLDYASPEQVRGEPLTTASDVYSLGVVAYELLAGARPYRLARVNAGEIQLATTQAPLPLASRTADGARLRRLLQGDLDAVLNRALKNDLAERYASVAELADDLRRYRDEQPVLARPDSLAYRLRKLAQRHPLPMASAAAAVLALAGGLTVALWQSRAAQEQARLARAEAANAQAVQGFMEDIFRTNSADRADPAAARATTAAELLDAAVQRVGSELDANPAVKLRLVDTLIALQRELGQHDEALRLAQLGVEVARQAAGQPGVSLVERLLVLSDAQQRVARLDEAVATAAAAEQALLQVSRPDPWLLARLALRQSLLQRDGGVTVGAQRNHIEHAVTVLRPLGPSYELSEALNAYADQLGGEGRTAESARTYQEAIDCCQALPGTRLRLPEMHAGLARVREAELDFDGYLASYRAAYDAAVRLQEKTPDVVLFAAADMVFALNSVSRPMEAVQWAEERPYLRNAGDLPQPSANSVYAMKHHAQALLAVGRIQQAQHVNDAALQAAGRLVANPQTERDLRDDAAAIRLAQGRPDEAARELATADLLARKHGLTRWPLNLRATLLQARLALALGDIGKAREFSDRYEPGPPGTGRHLRRHILHLQLQAEIALAAGEAQAALSLARQTVALIAGRLAFALGQARAQSLAGVALLEMGRLAEAEPELRAAIATQRALLDAELSPELGASAAALAQLLAQRGARPEAAQWLTLAEGIQRSQVRLPKGWNVAVDRARSALAPPLVQRRSPATLPTVLPL